MKHKGFDEEKARRLFVYTQNAFFRRPRPITGLENRIRAPPIIANFEHLEKICLEFDLPLVIFYDKEEEVERNWRNFCEFLLDERIPESLKHLSGETYPVLRTISRLYEAVKEYDLPRSRYPFKSDNLTKRIYLYIMRTRPYKCPPEGEQVEILRKSLFLSRGELSERAGLSKILITRIENRISKLNWELREKIGRVLYCDKGSANYMAYRVNKRFYQFILDRNLPLVEIDRLPKAENIHQDLKYSIVGLYYLFKYFNHGKIQ